MQVRDHLQGRPSEDINLPEHGLGNTQRSIEGSAHRGIINIGQISPVQYRGVASTTGAGGGSHLRRSGADIAPPKQGINLRAGGRYRISNRRIGRENRKRIIRSWQHGCILPSPLVT